MTFKMIYDTRNRNNLDKLAVNTRAIAYKWYQYCIDNQLQILIYETVRTKEQQAENVRKGASKTMRSYHLVGQALDFVPINSKGQAMWSINAYTTPKMLAAINQAKKLGFTWGGDWDNDGKWTDETFLDSPHLQYNYKGYGTDTFKAVAPTPVVNAPTTVVTGTSGEVSINLVDYLKSKGMGSSFAERAILAVKYGIANYSGTAKQNLHLLALVRADIEKPKSKEEAIVNTDTTPKSMVMNNTFRADLRSLVEKALKTGVLNNNKWLDKIDNNTITHEEVTLLQMSITNRQYVEPYLNGTFNKDMKELLEKAMESGDVTSDNWIKLVNEAKLPQEKALGLVVAILNRAVLEEDK